MLTQYLGNGGRLLLSSQDYLGEHGLTAFGRDRLGVLTDSNDLSATVASGPAGSLFDGLVANSLTFSYTNYSDALAPQPGTQVALVGNRGWPVALAHADGSGKALFMAFGFEGLPESQRGEAMNRAVGYLSWLGSSSARFDRPVASAGERVTLTIAIVNDGPAPIAHAGFTTTLPLSVTYAGGDPLTWRG